MKRDAVLKSLAGGLCAVLFLVAAVRLIQWEGERTRRALRDATADGGKETAERLADGAEPSADKPAERTDTVARDEGGGVHEGVSETTDRPAGLAGAPPGNASADVEQIAGGQGAEPPGMEIPAEDLPPPKPVLPRADPPAGPPLPDRPLPAADAPMPPGQKIAAPLRPVYPSGRGEPITIYHHASTLEEGSMRGMADLVRSQGQANLDHSAAAINYSLARQNEIQNRARWTQTYFGMRRMNRAYRAQERGPPPGMQDLVRYAQAGKPERLGPVELDPLTGAIGWPLLLRTERFADARSKLEAIFAERAQQGWIGPDEYLETRRAADQMKAALKAELRQLPPQQYMIAKRFLESLAYEVDLPAL